VTIECSTVEDPPFFGSNEAELRECARAADAGTVTLTVDGKFPLTLVETPLLTIDLPEDNILDVLPQQALSVAAGFVAPAGARDVRPRPTPRAP